MSRLSEYNKSNFINKMEDIKQGIKTTKHETKDINNNLDKNLTLNGYPKIDHKELNKNDMKKGKEIKYSFNLDLIKKKKSNIYDYLIK
jgi:hypothetical protein